VFVGAEGTLGVITGLGLRLHPTPTQRITATAGFDDLDALIDVGREFRDADGIAALELIDARASALTAEHMGVGPAVDGAWQLLIELAGDVDHTERLADALERAGNLWSTTEIRCLTATFDDRTVRHGRSSAGGRARPRCHPGAVRTHRRRQSASEPRGALRLTQSWNGMECLP
jgi:FAD/FMN-containing dehydrogenase